MSRTQRENVFAQAAFPKLVWEKVNLAFDKYEEGSLKDQKLNKKSLLALPEIKQHHFQPLTHLPMDIQLHLIDEVLNENISLKEMKEKTCHYRQQQLIKKAFIKLTNKRTWEEVTESFPLYAVDDKLDKFFGLDFKNTIPDAFRNFCQSALNSSLASAAKENCKTTALGHRIVLVPATIHDITSETILEIDNKYIGAHVILVNMIKVI